MTQLKLTFLLSDEWLRRSLNAGALGSIRAAMLEDNAMASPSIRSLLLAFKTSEGPEIEAIGTTFVQHTLAHAIWFRPHRQWFLSATHTPQDIEFTLDVCGDAMKHVAGILPSRFGSRP
jgi:glutamate-1-semialdehyde aminotransferase